MGRSWKRLFAHEQPPNLAQAFGVTSPPCQPGVLAPFTDAILVFPSYSSRVSFRFDVAEFLKNLTPAEYARRISTGSPEHAVF
jgi:hypothetical protein